MAKRNWRDSDSSKCSQTLDHLSHSYDLKDVESLFDKSFGFDSLAFHDDLIETWVGEDPVLTEKTVQDSELLTLKDTLNEIKDKLSSKDIEEWHNHTTRCNLAAAIIPYVKDAGVELCTQAWVKFYELLNSFSLVPQNKFLSVHLCEAPGAFVTCLNYHLQNTKFRHMWDWRATTLNPYYEGNSLDATIPDDRLIRHTYSQWYFGRDGSGDITCRGYLEDLHSYMSKVKQDQEMDIFLVTADGSRDCQINPAEQEALVSRLHYCELIAACLLLAKGGNFVLKVFTLFEPASVALMFLLNLLFKEVHAKKPATSKSGNSEVYLVCLNFRNNVKIETLWKLLEVIVYDEKPGTLQFKHDIPSAFLQQHLKCCQLFSEWQADTIEFNISLYENFSQKAERELESKQKLALDLFLKKTRFQARHRTKRLSEYKRDKSSFYIPQNNQLQPLSKWPQKHLKGTFYLRQNLSSMSWEERIEHLEHHDLMCPDKILRNQEVFKDEEFDEWSDVEKGRPFSFILNSRLCDTALMSDMTMLVTNSDLSNMKKLGYQEHVNEVGQLLSEIISPFGNSDRSSSFQSKKGEVCPTVVFWDVDQGTESTFPIYQSFMNKVDSGHFNVQHVIDDKDLAATLRSARYIIVNVTRAPGKVDAKNPFQSDYEELMIRKNVIFAVTQVLKHLKHGSQLILLTASSLTRMTAGLVYSLARSFESTSVKCHPNLWLHQMFVFTKFQHLCPALGQHLRDLSDQLCSETSTTSECLLEVVSFAFILNDRKYVQFLTSYNNYMVAGFINLMLDYYKKMNQKVQ
ncbi:cap-specific mRNA (nucleoside-2-O-)-methyltransferase 2 [Biomphalaria glabrata]|nr:cap-specific mRNA (nucleoside-2-O-)-methyltransferase 2 [Biomphalaria glabrata]